MKMLVLLFALVACNSSDKTCVGDHCVCPATEACQHDCVPGGADCEVQCAPGESCDVGCAAGESCHVECSGTSQCDVDCAGSTDCHVTCPATGCTVTNCTGEQCIVSCGNAGSATRNGTTASCP